MKEKKVLSTLDIQLRIQESYPSKYKGCKVWGVPRGGYNIAMIIQMLGLGTLVDDIQKCNLVVDDVVDSGITKARYVNQGYTFYSPYEKPTQWLVFPWEESQQGDAEDLITRVLQIIGEDPTREGLLETPKRVVKSWNDLYVGYKQVALDHVKLFKATSQDMVICKDIEFYSTCEHHMLPFHGRIHIGYIPKEHIIGLSKLARISDVFAKRLQVQERLTHEIAFFLNVNLKCQGVMVIIEAKHHCMCGRGVSKQHSSMITSAIHGLFKKPEVKGEFLKLVYG